MTKKHLINHNKEHKAQQHCPCSNRYKKYNEHYPDIICDKCVALATDKSCNKIAFHTITKDGKGIQGIYAASEKLYRSTICYIKEIKCNAEEASFGGIIIMPFKRNRNTKAGHSSTEQ